MYIETSKCQYSFGNTNIAKSNCQYSLGNMNIETLIRGVGFYGESISALLHWLLPSEDRCCCCCGREGAWGVYM